MVVVVIIILSLGFSCSESPPSHYALAKCKVHGSSNT